MTIQDIRKKKVNQGKRYDKDPFYQSAEWKSCRTRFLMSEPWQSLPSLNGKKYENRFCVECWKQGKIVETHTIDHIQRKRENGSWTDFSNLQGLCLSHHNAKSAHERNEKYKK
jgi:5-methylcytosine-specific restriction enzyme A